MKKGNDGAAASRHVAVADDGKADVLRPRVGVGRDEELVGNQLGSAVKIHRVHRLVGGERHHLLYAAVQTCVDHILRSVDIGLNGLVGIVLAGGNLL